MPINLEFQTKYECNFNSAKVLLIVLQFDLKFLLDFHFLPLTRLFFYFQLRPFLIQSKVLRQWTELWICISIVDLSFSTRLKLCSDNNYLWPCDGFFFCNTQMFWLFIIKSAKNHWFLSLTNLYLTAVNLPGVRWLAL